VSATTRPEIERAVQTALSSVAPEADFATFDPKQSLREQLDLDSMDFLNFVIGLHGALGVDVPERDYASLATAESAVDYLLAAVRRKDR
jgi:acyl carrier protein